MKYVLLSIFMAFVVCNPTTILKANRQSDDYNLVDLSNLDYNAPEDCTIQPIEEILSEDFGVYHENSTNAVSSETYDTYMEAYYRGLCYNMGMNYKGSCGYVALGMLLSYYDSFLNDNIIPENYDVASVGSGTDMVARENSPGVVCDTISYESCQTFKKENPLQLDAHEYYSLMLSKSTSLHAKFLMLAHYYGLDDFSDNDNPFGSNYSKRITVLQKYFSDIGISESDYKITMCVDSTYKVQKFIRENINKGNPVLASVSNSKSSHAVICYDYDNTGIYCNMGWIGSADYAHFPVSNRYDTYNNAMVIEFNYDHSHSLNYQVVNNNTTKEYCYCNCNIISYKPINHEFNVFYEPYNNYYHKSYCHCGDFIYEKHSWSATIVTLSFDLACKQCGAPNLGGGGSEICSLNLRKGRQNK